MTGKATAARELITSSRLREVLNYDPETGVFTRLIPCRGRNAGGKAGSLNAAGYVQIKVDRNLYLAHRLAWLYMTTEWPGSEIDHINGVRRDNRFLNLRDVDRRTNGQNIHRAHKDNKSGLLGVSWSKEKRKWHVRIRVEAAPMFIGYFDDKEVAHDAYLGAKRKFHSGCTL